MDSKRKVMLVLAILILLASIVNTVNMILTITGMASGTASFCVVGVPNITTILNQIVNVNQEFYYLVNCSQDCGETRIFSRVVIPSLSSFAMNLSTGEINFTPQTGDEGDYDVYVYCSKTGMPTDSELFTLTVNCTINAPNITEIPNLNTTVGQEFTYQVECNKDCGETLYFYNLTIPTLGSFAMNSSGFINFTTQDGEEGTYSITIYCDKDAFSADTEEFTLNVQPWYRGPDNLGCSASSESVYLNWSSIAGASYYNIYYSTNISSIMTLDLNSVPADVTKVGGISSNNWNDTNISETQKKYYIVSVVKNGIENLTSDIPIGKFTYNYTAPLSSTYGTLASNRISFYLNVSYSAENFLQEVPVGLNPTISRLDKSNVSGEFLTTHVRGLNDGNNFMLNISEGYQVTVDQAYNHTICGKILNEPYILRYDVVTSSSYGPLASNWRGVFDFNKSYTAESFLQEIPAGLNPTISRLDKSNVSGEFLTTHVRGLNDGNNFNVNEGTGYVITVDGNYNHTLCTECFG
ncbi:MAG: hypothetical protein ABH824_05610 [Nanoarchaeota archaeon]|nr:hypothetical protein [Nanoarchaeota archaeon]MBU1632324.1 hypothetical protein [Nanoarchaeota archaeon]MBU1875883.1 hypothetical protein [Nanoarchaeota archaeon]